MANSSFRERIGFAIAKGGAIASALWLLKKLGHIEVYRVFVSRPLAELYREPDRLCRFSFRHLSTGNDVKTLDDRLRTQLEDHLGRGLDRLVTEGSVAYFLADGEHVVCQLVISGRATIHLDVPAGVVLAIGKRSAFLSYLYTHDSYRRAGAASQLLDLASKHLADCGYERVIAHVSATNVPSLNAFAASNWRRVGTIWTTRSARRLGSTGLGRHDMAVYPATRTPAG